MLESVYTYESNVDRILLITTGIAVLCGLAGALAGTTSVLRRNSGLLAMIVLTVVLGQLLFDLAYLANRHKLPSEALVNLLLYGFPAAGLLLGLVPAVRRRPYLWTGMALFAVAATVAARLWLDLLIGPYSGANGLVVLGLALALGAFVATRPAFRSTFDVVLGLTCGLAFAWYLSVWAVSIWDLDYRLRSLLPAAGALIGIGAGYLYRRRTRTPPAAAAAGPGG